MSNKAIIAMSGGVDSSVAAYLMKEQGYDCMGITMKLFDNDDIGISNEKACCSIKDVEDARSVANSLGIPFHVFNFAGDFNEQVIDRFIHAYENGETPNPCIDCNRFMKFEKLMTRAKQLDVDYVVTGHYARIEYDEKSGRYLLKKGIDETKDQSYALHTMTQKQLAHTHFPLGELRKDEIREIAAEKGFINAKKRDSQDICFVRDGDYVGFIQQYTGKKYKGGNFIDGNGKVLGKHDGLIRYTIGQRKGIGLSFNKPMYVGDKDIENNTVTLCENAKLFSKSLTARDFNWISCEQPEEPIRVKAKIRYNQKERWATAKQTPSGLVSVEFDEPQRAIAKGQAVVLYDGDVVVGGGTIC
ncbi:MAG: tRNA 2-thiouridine(34) synthase MnmA [Oscillospiraceae bacterium]|nr:tRNA 2-thiouridine(34) synthase MnmA [Oscillospiraceae bacterium]